MNIIVKGLVWISFFFYGMAIADNTWHGLIVEPENRCSPYDKDEQYPYPSSIEYKIVAQMGGGDLWSLYRSLLHFNNKDRYRTHNRDK